MSSVQMLRHLTSNKVELNILDKVTKGINKYPRNLSERLAYYNNIHNSAAKNAKVSEPFKRSLSLFVCSVSDAVSKIKKDFP